MFGKTKGASANYIMAIKDYSNTIKAIEDGSFHVPFNKDIYSKLLKNMASKVDDVKELGKFAKITKKDKKDVLHFWEGLISEGYTLLAVQYDVKSPSFDKLCNNDTIKYVCTV